MQPHLRDLQDGRLLPDDARLWRAGQEFIVIERPRIVAALAV